MLALPHVVVAALSRVRFRLPMYYRLAEVLLRVRHAIPAAVGAVVGVVRVARVLVVPVFLLGRPSPRAILLVLMLLLGTRPIVGAVLRPLLVLLLPFVSKVQGSMVSGGLTC